jgi:DNA polymerase III psi subunit
MRRKVKMDKKPIQTIEVTARQGEWVITIHRFYPQDAHNTAMWHLTMNFTQNHARAAFWQQAQAVLARMDTACR